VCYKFTKTLPENVKRRSILQQWLLISSARPIESHSGARGKHSRGSLSQSHSDWNIPPTFDQENFTHPSPSQWACLSPLVRWRLGGGWSSAEGVRVEAPNLAEGTDRVGCREGVSPTHWRRVLGRGLCPIPRKFLDFWVENGTIWCILGAIYGGCSNLKLYGLLRCTSTMCSAVIRWQGPTNVAAPGKLPPSPQSTGLSSAASHKLTHITGRLHC